MAQLSSASGQDNLNDIFLRAFKDCIKGIVTNLSTRPDDPTTTTAIQIIVAHLNNDFIRLTYVIDIIQDRVYQDAQWTSAAIAVYDTLALSLDAYFPHPGLPLQGPLVVQHQLMRALQTQFTSMMAVETWSAAFTFFLAQLCRSTESIGRLTPGIMLHVISGMVESTHLFHDSNLDLLFEVINSAGPVLDAQAMEVIVEFGKSLQLLRERARGRGNVVGMAVFGLVRLRELGWNVNPNKSD